MNPLRHLRRKLLTPGRELPFTVGIVILAVAIPTAGLLFFMNRAMNGERQELLAALQASRQDALRQARIQLQHAVDTLTETGITPQDKETPSAAAARFHQIMELGHASGCLILDASGAVVYPVLTEPERPFVTRADAAEAADDLWHEYETTLQEEGPGATAQAAATFIAEKDTPRLRGIASEDGRHMQATAALAAAFSLPVSDTRHGENLSIVEAAILQSDPPLPAAQRLFFQQELARMGRSVTIPHAEAESISLTMASRYAVPEEAGVFTPVPGDATCTALRLTGQHTVLLFHQEKLHATLTSAAQQSLAAHGLTGSLQRAGEPLPADTLASLPADGALRGWLISAGGPDGAEAVAGRIATLKRLYLLAAVCGSLFIGLLAAWAIRRYAARSRDAAVRQDFLNLVSHELKTPLTSIRMFVDSLADGGLEDPERARTYLDYISRENARLSRLVENFLTFSRLESGRMVFDYHTIHPAEVIEAVRQVTAGRATAPGVQLDCSAPAELPLIRADTGALTTALVNLVDNAIKYSGEKKHIVLSAAAAPGHGSILFSVTDDGIGMNADTLGRMGEKFFRDRAAAAAGRSGFGLGLHIVRSILEAHGTSLEVTSTPGEGSRFSFRLPAAPDET